MQDDPVLALQKHLAGERNFEPQSSTFRWKNHQSWWFDKDSKASLKVWWNQDLAQWYQSFSSWNWYLFEYCPDHIPFFIPMMYSQYKGIRIHIIYLYISYYIRYPISYVRIHIWYIVYHQTYHISSNISYIPIIYIIYFNNISYIPIIYHNITMISSIFFSGYLTVRSLEHLPGHGLKYGTEVLQLLPTVQWTGAHMVHRYGGETGRPESDDIYIYVILSISLSVSLMVNTLYIYTYA